MAYNIDSTRYLGDGRLTIDAREAIRFWRDRDCPEGCFLAEFAGMEGEVQIEQPWWHGEGSGRTEDVFREALALTRGEADILLVWEGGDSFTGLRVRDGVVAETGVRITLEGGV